MYCKHCGKFTENVDGVCITCRDPLEVTNEIAEESRELTQEIQDLKVSMDESQEEGKKLEEKFASSKESSQEMNVSKEEKKVNEDTLEHKEVKQDENVLEHKEVKQDENVLGHKEVNQGEIVLEHKEVNQGENVLEQKEETQVENGENLRKELSPNLKKIQKIGSDKWNHFLRNTGKEMISISTIKESAFLLIVTLCISTLLSLILTLLANAFFKSQIDSLLSQLVEVFSDESNKGFLTFYRLLRMSYLHSIKLSVSAVGESFVVHMNIHVLLLALIPFVSMFFSWMLLCHQKVRSSLKFLFSQETTFQNKKALPITLNVTFVLTILFFLTSLIPMNLAKGMFMKVKISYGGFSSLLGTILITLLSCYIITGILKLREIKTLQAGSLLWNLKQYYKKYAMGVIVSSILIMLITIIREGMWKAIGSILLALPNVFLIVANALSFGGFQIASGGSVTTLRSSMNGFQVTCSVILALSWCIFLWYLLYQMYLKFEKSDRKNYIKNVGIFTGVILLIQLFVYYVSRVRISLSALGSSEVGVAFKVNILLSLLVFVLISAGAMACAYYLPELLHKKGSKDEVFFVGTWKRLDMTIMIALSILVCLTYLGMTHKKNDSVSSGSIIGNGESSKGDSYSMIHPESMEIFQDGFVFRSYNGIYTFEKEKVKKMSLSDDMTSYFNDSNYYYSKSSNRILRVNKNNAMLLDSKGKELYKQEVTFDQLLTASKEFDKLLFFVDGEITLFDKKENKFTTLEGITNYDYLDFYFDESEENLFLVGESISCYNIDSKKLDVVMDETPEYILDSSYNLTAKIYVFKEGKLVQPVGDTNKKYYVKNMVRDYESYKVIIENGKESPVSLPDMVWAESINDEGTKFLVTFTEYGDYYLYDAVEAELTNISTQIRYITSNEKVEG